MQSLLIATFILFFAPDLAQCHSGGLAGPEPQDFIQKAVNQVTQELREGSPENARRDFKRAYVNPARFTDGMYFSSPTGMLNFQMQIMTLLWNSPQWAQMVPDTRASFLKIALRHDYSFPQYRRDILNRLRKIATVEAMASIYMAAQINPSYIDLGKTQIPEGYHAANHAGFFNWMIDRFQQRDLSAQPPSPPAMVEWIHQWVGRSFSNANDLLAAMDNHSSESARHLLSYLVEDYPKAKRVLTRNNTNKYYFLTHNLPPMRPCQKLRDRADLD